MLGSDVLLCFIFYSTLLILKMYIIAIITGQVRLRKKAFANPEDAERHGGEQFCRTDPYVERCRRRKKLIRVWNDVRAFGLHILAFETTEPNNVESLHEEVNLLCESLHRAQVTHTHAVTCQWLTHRPAPEDGSILWDPLVVLV
uniref:Prostaglandin E synthase n=1 Tax=Cyprinus carpio carpio TaxID=630221 RepID=A0A9J8D7R4_CYPCA